MPAVFLVIIFSLFRRRNLVTQLLDGCLFAILATYFLIISRDGGVLRSESFSMCWTRYFSCCGESSRRGCAAAARDRVLFWWRRVKVDAATPYIFAAARYEICPSGPCELIAASAFSIAVMVVELWGFEIGGFYFGRCRGCCIV